MMIVCLPTIGNSGLEEKVYNHFGSAPYFLIYNTETKESNFVKNGNEHHQHGSCQPTGIISQHGVDAVMTCGMGSRAVGLLNQGGVKVYKLEDGSASSAISSIESGNLNELTMDGACSAHDCH